jgi:pimeloyl-ACP methyl ester carboxylesterase
VGQIVLVHGAWHGPWCWDRVIRPLRDLGHVVVATELHRGSLEADTAAVQDDVRRLVDASGPVVVCGHSYGGAVVTGLEPDGIAQLACIAGFLLDAGESCARAGTERFEAVSPPELVVRRDDGTSVLDPHLAAVHLFGDCTLEDQHWALGHVREQVMGTLTASPARTVWRDVPTTYAVCTEDRIVNPELQRHLAARAATTVVEWPTSHSPLVSHPRLVVDLLHTLLGA